MSKEIGFSEPVTIFHERRLPEPAIPVGYSALIHAHNLSVPLPRQLCAIGSRHRITEKDGWRILTPRHAPKPTLEGQLTFALKNEGLDLTVLKRLFQIVDPPDIEAIVQRTPTGSYARRIWFLYEWLLDQRLNLPDAETGSYVLAVNPNQQWAASEERSSRHRVKNNLPGTPLFCPMVFRTKTLDDFISLNLRERARNIIADIPHDIMARTAAFLLLSDSRASYTIEGERPSQNRIQRWGQAIAKAGQQHLDLPELLRLQKLVIGDDRFVQLGLRTEGGFVGQRDRQSQMPLPEHISAKPDDLLTLVEGLLAFHHRSVQHLDPIIAATILAFGFVYIHPFEDGNGRIHRYLIHHVLSAHGFNPPGLIFPISAAILERIDAYRNVLESYSTRLLPLIEWEPTDRFNIHVNNDTADFYRFFDATLHAEFLFSCVQQTIEDELPRETGFLQRYDQFCRQINAMVDMPEQTLDLLFRFLDQNNGRLPKRRREKEFAQLMDDEVSRIESIFLDLFLTPSADSET